MNAEQAHRREQDALLLLAAQRLLEHDARIAERARVAGRRRIVTAGVLSGAASAMFIGPQLLVPGADPSLFTVAAGLTFPAGVAALWLVGLRLAGRFDEVDYRRPHRTQPERVRRGEAPR